MIFKRTPVSLTLIAAVVLISSIQMFAQTSSPPITAKSLIDSVKGMTADEAVKFALKNNGELQALRSETEAAKKLIDQARQRQRIQVNANGLQQTVVKSHRYTIQGTMPLELGGRRKTRVLTAEKRAEVKVWDAKRKETELAAAVREKFGKSYAMILQFGLVEELLGSIERTYSLVTERVREGKSAPLEQNMVLVELNRIRAIRESAESKARISLIEFEALIGRDDGIPLRLNGDFDETLTNISSRTELIARAIRERPDLLLLRSMEDLADAKIRASESSNKLDAAATLGYQRLRISDSVQFNYLVFGINFMLPVKNRGRDQIEAAVIDKRAMEQRRAFGELVVKQDVNKAIVRYESAVRSREISRSGVVSEASKNLDVVRQMYDLGAYSLLEYLAEQRRVIDLRKRLIDAELEVFLSKIEVDRASNAPGLVTK
jgi:cobalt-zinc-cadmium efflux system outer membrane protein